MIRVKGAVTVPLVRESHERLHALIREKGLKKVLFDGLEMAVPATDIPLELWKLDQQREGPKLKRAIVFSPDTRLAYHARLAFAEDDFSLFHDVPSALAWLGKK
ncbi:MAG TPA: hypothetical protein VL688_05955 [Verrucomicrobiae bacterium]|nr:hypothetical protein [Verrucomicrobiae bacterium]